MAVTVSASPMMDGPDTMGLENGVPKTPMPVGTTPVPFGTPSFPSMQDPVLSHPLASSPKKGPKAIKKPANAPKRFKSSFIFFSMAKHKQIKEELANQGHAAKTTNITKMVSDAWRNMGPDERETYDELARQDKARYELEKASYQGPTGASQAKKQRDPNAPKRPMSAFLAFANSRRGEVKSNNPDCSNGEISKLLSRMWKEAPEGLKQKYRDNETALWAAYKVGIVEWRKKNDGRTKGGKGDGTSNSSNNRKKKAKDHHQHPNSESPPTSAPAGFEAQNFSGRAIRQSGINIVGNPNQDEMMAASALRGVRGAPSYSGYHPNGNRHVGSSSPGAMNPQTQYCIPPAAPPSSAGGYSSQMFGMTGMHPYPAPPPHVNAEVKSIGAPVDGSPTTAVQREPAPAHPPYSNDIASRGHFEVGYPYQQYGEVRFHVFGNNQSVIKQSMHSHTPASHYHNPIMGHTDQRHSLSQLASLAGNQPDGNDNRGCGVPENHADTCGEASLGPNSFLNHGVSNRLDQDYDDPPTHTEGV